MTDTDRKELGKFLRDLAEKTEAKRDAQRLRSLTRAQLTGEAFGYRQAAYAVENFITEGTNIQ